MTHDSIEISDEHGNKTRYYGLLSDGMLSEGELLFLAELKADLSRLDEAIGEKRKSMYDYNEAVAEFGDKWFIAPAKWTPFNLLIQ
jgi:hypothetical protein